MIYKTIIPSERLRPFIKDYLLLRFNFDKDDHLPIKPFPANTQHSLVFYLRGSVKAFDPNTGCYKTFAKTAINGSQISRFDFHISRDYLLFSVNFQPHILSKFLRLPLTEFINDRIDAEAILNPEIHAVHEQMADSPTCENILRVTEDYLWKRIQYAKISFQPIDTAILLVAENPGVYSIEQLANYSCLSVSQFERRFIQQTGITPKFYARINRFYQAYALKDRQPQFDWLRIAMETGYYDYQHLVKDFKLFSGTTPNSLLQAQARSPERILGIG